jgi:hypothetical protein
MFEPNRAWKYEEITLAAQDGEEADGLSFEASWLSTAGTG